MIIVDRAALVELLQAEIAAGLSCASPREIAEECADKIAIQAQGSRSAIAAVADEIICERLRQISEEGYSPRRDDMYCGDGSLALAAAYYAAPVEIRCEVLTGCGCRAVGECAHNAFPRMTWQRAWPWSSEPKRKSRRHDLVRAAALIVAEIERLDRATGDAA